MYYEECYPPVMLFYTGESESEVVNHLHSETICGTYMGGRNST